MNPRDRIAALLVAVTLAAAPLMLGSAPRWAACVASLLGLIAAVPYATSRRVASPLSPLLLLIGAALALTALQLVPLPAGLVSLLSPTRHAMAVDHARALGESAPGLMTLSYDWPATLVEAGKLSGYAALAFACLRLATSPSGRRLLASLIAIGGAAMALIALGHYATGAERVFGVYEPQSYARTYMAPILSENHLAGYLVLSVPVALALAVDGRGVRRVAWVCAAVIAAGVALLTRSRGGALALVVGVGLAAAMFVVQRQRGTRHGRSSTDWSVLIPAAIVAVCTVVLLAVFAAGGVASELRATDMSELDDPGSKFAAWGSSLSLLDDNRWAGVGRGAFEAAFTRFHSEGQTFSHVENEYLQALLDWGVVGGVGLTVLLVMVMVMASRRWRAGPIEAGAFAGVSALGLQNAADFNLELPGVAMPALAALAILVRTQLRAGRWFEERTLRGRPLPAISPRIGRAVLLGAGAACVALAASPVGRTARQDAAMLEPIVAEERADAMKLAPIVAEARIDAIARAADALARHPADYVIAGLTARALFARRDPRAVPMINRALWLNPHNAGLHWLAARMLAVSQRPEQSLVEYSLALDRSPRAKQILAELVARFPDPAMAARGMPREPSRAPRITKDLVALGRDDVALAYAESALASNPDDPVLLRQAAKMALARGRARDAARWAVDAYDRRPDLPNTRLVADALEAAGETARAIGILRQAAEVAGQRAQTRTLRQILPRLAALERAAGELEAAKTSLKRFVSLAPPEVADLAAAHRDLAALEEQLGNVHNAQWHRDRARELGAASSQGDQK